MVEEDGDEPQLVVNLETESEARSAALYSVVARLQELDYALLGISQRQQNLESVFLKLTTSTV